MLRIYLTTTTLLLLLPPLPVASLWAPGAALIMLLSLFFYLTSPSLITTISPFFYFDPLSVFLVLITLWVSALIVVASQKIYILILHPKLFLFYVVSLAIVLTSAFTTHNFLLFYVFFESSLVPTLLLILGWGYQPERIQARFYLIMYTVTASLPLLIALTLLLKNGGHLSIVLPYWNFPSTLATAQVWWIIIITAFLVKTPLYLTHLWLPKAHVEAPVAGSIVLAGVLLKLGRYGLLRLIVKFIHLAPFSLPIFTTIALIGGIITGFICVRQTDIKALIAYSSVRHIGLATAGIFSNTVWGWQGAFMMLIAHGLCSSCIFALANITYEAVGSRSLYLTKGMAALFPSLAFWWFCFSACNMAAPPSINLGAEIFLITSTMSVHLFYIIPLALIAFMAAAYSLLLFTSTQHGGTPHFLAPMVLLTPRNYTTCALHFLPLIFFILKLDLVSSWLW